MKEIDFALKMANRIAMSPECVEYLTECYKVLLSDDKSVSTFSTCRDIYMKTFSIFCVKPALSAAAKRLSLHSETVELMFLMFCAEKLHGGYARRGLGDALFYHTMADFKYKAEECKRVRGVWGTFVSYWYGGFFRMNRFALGRFQFELTRYPFATQTFGGVKVRRFSPVVNFHIPSSGTLSAEGRTDAYRQAHEFYREVFNSEPTVFVCLSWLLYPDYGEVYPKGSNLLDFMQDFAIVKSVRLPGFSDAWRVFGSDCKKPPMLLPQDTALQRAFRKRMIEKKPNGMGYGVAVFDGEKLLTRDYN